MGAETTLYPPVKRFLESLGFEVKGEVCGCDVVALDKGVPTSVVIAELKLTFTLDLLLQAVDRLPACDDVWLAVRASRRGRGYPSEETHDLQEPPFGCSPNRRCSHIMSIGLGARGK